MIRRWDTGRQANAPVGISNTPEEGGLPHRQPLLLREVGTKGRGKDDGWCVNKPYERQTEAELLNTVNSAPLDFCVQVARFVEALGTGLFASVASTPKLGSEPTGPSPVVAPDQRSVSLDTKAVFLCCSATMLYNGFTEHRLNQFQRRGRPNMLEKLRGLILYQYIEQVIIRYRSDDLPSLSAQVSYYLILAFFPFLLFVINLLSFTPLSSELLIADFSSFLPYETGILIKNLLLQTVHAKSKTLLILGMIAGLWASSRGMYAIIRGLNRSYNVRENRGFIKLNLIALGTTIGVTGMIIFAFTLIVFGEIIGSNVFNLIGAKALFDTIWVFLRYGIPLGVMSITFYLIYKYAPNKRLEFKDIKVGTIFATVGWITTSIIFSFYVNSFANYERVYGSLGGVIGLISWLYFSALIVLLGGELNAISSDLRSREKVSGTRLR